MTRDPDLDDLKAALDAATPAPDSGRKAANLALARENFAALQGSREMARPMSSSAGNGPWTRIRRMFASMTSRGALATTTALVACGFLFLTPQGQDLLTPPDPVGEPEPLPAVLPEPQPLAPVLDADDRAAPVGNEVRLAPAELADGAADALREEPAPAPSAALPRLSREIAPRIVAPRAAPGQNASPDALLGGGVASLAEPPVARLYDPGTESFATAEDNPVKVTAEDPVSTFSIDVDTASYAVVRSSLMRGQLPPRDAVRIEEMVNYFPYDYPAPEAGEAPFRATLGVMQTPWNPGTRIVHIGLQGTLPAVEDRPPLNLVFLIDTSGSMDDPAKLPLLIQSFRLMLPELRPDDEVAIVTYAGSAGLVLPPTAAADRAAIEAALAGLRAGGSTNGQGGLEQAYAVAEGMAAGGEIGRVILATDGDFNVGLSDPSGLEDYIAGKRETGTYLSVLGFGRGNLQDATMQALAQSGNGTAAYIDTLSEARKVLVDQLTGALFPIADDVKVQVEFNPAEVAEYRLIGYETRALRREDFNNDAVDAGELGAGHSVTALYEVTPVGSPARLTDPLRYGASGTAADAGEAGEGNGELGFLKLRYKAPGAEDSVLVETPITAGLPAGNEARFATAIAGFGQLLRGATYLGDWGWDEAIALAAETRGADPYGYRGEAVQLMRLAQSLSR